MPSKKRKSGKQKGPTTRTTTTAPRHAMLGIQISDTTAGTDQVTILCDEDWLSPEDERIRDRLQPFQEVAKFLTQQQPSARVNQHLDKKQFAVENIKGIKWCKGLHYLVKWEGWDSKWNNWEPARNMLCPNLMKPFNKLADWLRSQHTSSKRIRKAAPAAADDESDAFDQEKSTNDDNNNSSSNKDMPSNNENAGDTSNDSGLPEADKQEEEEEEMDGPGPAGDRLLYYNKLGVDRDSSEEVIRRRFRLLAAAYHPDRNVGASPGILLENEKEFKELNKAKTVLTDPDLKARYDAGKNPHQTEAS